MTVKPAESMHALQIKFMGLVQPSIWWAPQGRDRGPNIIASWPSAVVSSLPLRLNQSPIQAVVHSPSHRLRRLSPALPLLRLHTPPPLH
uniref:Uncharacterized protein n=1 Tax=Oryza punctata TaxID=4537 RepID=A0A0E0M3P1_ORYPU